MARIRNDGWKDDLILKEALQKYVKDGLTRDEIMDFAIRDFNEYAWSIRKATTLRNKLSRLHCFN